MEKSLNYQARREVLQQVAPQYREAALSQKRMLLDAFVATPGGCSIMPKRSSNRMDIHSRTSMDRTSNMHSFWLGTPPTASVPNGSSLFSLPS